MKARAPGKIVLTGAYAVLRGAPALVLAVDRYAVADSERPDPAPSAELRAAFGDRPAPSVDTSALFESDVKLGLGSSAAVTVAALAASRSAVEVADRATLFRDARAAHERAQGGGSGVDVAASTYGGVLAYRVGETPARRAWPAGLCLDVFFAGQSAKTSSLLAEVRALEVRAPARHAAVMNELAESSVEAARVFERPLELVRVAQRFARGLRLLGEAAGAPIVPPAFAELSAAAEAESAAFFGAGAGGGDVAVRLGSERAGAAFVDRAARLGLVRLDVRLDLHGAVHLPRTS